MIRILVNIKNNSPFLQTISGEVVAEYINYINVDAQPIEILRCDFDFRPNNTGYSKIKCEDRAVFYALKPQMDIMLKSYLCGLGITPHCFSWVEDSKDKPLETWKEEKERDYEASDEYKFSRPKKS